jgi:hypothetical protein
MNAPKCVTCGHVERSHDPVCKNGCGCHFRAPSQCPLGNAKHNGSKGHTCNCVPGQIDLLDIVS